MESHFLAHRAYFYRDSLSHTFNFAMPITKPQISLNEYPDYW